MGIGNNKRSNKDHIELEGVLERITFYNEENGFLIGKLKGSEEKTEIAVVGKADKFNVVRHWYFPVHGPCTQSMANNSLLIPSRANSCICIWDKKIPSQWLNPRNRQDLCQENCGSFWSRYSSCNF